MITKEQMREIVRRKPFVPVRVYMNDGTVYDIGPEDKMFLTPEWLHQCISDDPATGVFTRKNFIYLPWVARVEELAPPVTPAVAG